MKRIIFLTGFFFVCIGAFGQQNKLQHNLNFEKWEAGQPTGWESFGKGNYELGIDSVTPKSGRGAATIASTEEEGDFKAWAYTLPQNYTGGEMTLTGFIKTENVTGGYAGLWMRMDPEIGFDNMHDRGITGTTNWKQYRVTLALNPARTKKIVVGGLLVGKGKMWLDDLKVSIDGKDLSEVKGRARTIFPAELDTAFRRGSGISKVETYTLAQVENLRILGLVWGFLKYYHPAVAAGRYNWDAELFRILPRITAANSAEYRDKILLDWIEGMGAFEERKKVPPKSAAVKYLPDLKWISASGLAPKLVLRLNEVKNAVRPKEHYYVTLDPNVQNPQFTNEGAYAHMRYPDAGYRLLALYRYWNMVQYYFPSRDLTDKDWKEALPEFIPKIEAAANDTAYELVLLELVGRIQDTHAGLWNAPAKEGFLGTRYVPAVLTFVEGKPLVTGYFNDSAGRQTGLQKGDEILSIGGVPVARIVEARRRYNGASNPPTQLRNIARDLLRTNDSVLAIAYRRKGVERSTVTQTYTSKEVALPDFSEAADTAFKILPGNIAYIHNGSLKSADVPKIQKVLAGTKGLIIDDRNYPSDFPIYMLSEVLMPDKRPFVKFTAGSLEDPGTFTFRGAPLTVGKKRSNFYKGQIVILVNETTQSSAEFHAMAYRTHPNATVMGSTTAGADGNVSKIVFPGGAGTWISGLGVYYPNGGQTQRTGIVPDIEATPTQAGILEGRDEVLERAIAFIAGK